MKKAFQWLDRYFEVTVASVLLVMMTLFTVIQIICRHLSATPLPWTEEMTRYMFVWMVFISLGYAVKSDSHIRITFIRTFCKRKGQYALDMIANIASLVFAAICAYAGAKMMLTIAAGGQTSVSLAFIPMWLVYLVMPIGFTLFCVRLVQNMLLLTKKLHAGAEIKNESELFAEGE